MRINNSLLCSFLLASTILTTCTAALAATQFNYYLIDGKRYYPLSYVKKGYALVGNASWYSVASNFGTQTASGHPFSDTKFTAASPVLPMGTRLLVTNLKNHRSVVVKITDRGPYRFHRILDLSPVAAAQLGYKEAGFAHVKAITL